MTNMLLGLVGPLLVGPLTFLVVQGIKALSLTVDNLSPTVKRFAVPAIAVILSLGARAMHVDLACDVNADINCLNTLTPDVVKGLVGAGVAFALHYLKTVKPPANG